ncbi:hypothetical protein O988_09897 [Pseudogymnoascus sp. VKM F-3808]|nr:hypothetical protein O988_09897 [Pseudogymnoascus sp. VKM F-3808]
MAGDRMKPSNSLASTVSGIVVRSQQQWHMVVLSLLNPEGQLNVWPKRLPLAIVPLSIELQTPHRCAILLILIAALIDNRPHLDAKLVLPLRDAAVGVGDAGEGVRDGSELLVGRRETGQRNFYRGAGAADDGVEDVAGDWGFGGGHCERDLQRGRGWRGRGLWGRINRFASRCLQSPVESGGGLLMWTEGESDCYQIYNKQHSYT